MLHTVSRKTFTAILLVLAAGGADAQSLSNADGPAEIPPSSFTGRQYVDSNGCVFVRAGFDGAVNWVPRVNRQREVLCGFQPSLAAAAPAPAPSPAPEPTPPRVVVAPAAVPAPTPTPAPVPRVTAPAGPSQVVSVTPAPTPPVQVRPVQIQPTAVQPTTVQPVQVRPTPAPAPTPRIVAAPKPAPAPAPAAAPPANVKPPSPEALATACPNASVLSQRYLPSGKWAVRCGPQKDHPGNYRVPIPTAPSAGGGAVVASAPPVIPAGPEIKPPKGYRPAFDDGRLNPNRGVQTRTGFEQMRLVWTAGVPRRLVDQATGRDVTKLFPALRFPFVSMEQQRKYVQANGWPAASGVTSEAPSRVTVATKTTPTATVAPPRASSGHRFVQVGTFGVPSNAQASAARLQQMGLPVRIGTYTKRGKTYRIVMAGPFGDATQLSRALSAARRAGFSDAFTRK